MHYKRAQRTGVIRPSDGPMLKAPNVGPCAVSGCDRLAVTKRLCDAHYQRVRKQGHPGDAPVRAKRAPGSGGRWVDNGGYVILTIDGRRTSEHRHVMEHELGRPLWPDESVHHKNGNRADNRIDNLELWSRYQPSGQRVEDKLTWAAEIIRRYG